MLPSLLCRVSPQREKLSCCQCVAQSLLFLFWWRKRTSNEDEIFMACACFLRFDPAPLKRSRHEDAGGSLLIDGQVVLRLFCPGDESFLTSFHELWTSVNLMPSRIIFFMRFLNLIQCSELETAGGPKNFPPPSLRCETWMKRSLAIKIEGQLSETSPQYSLASLSLFFFCKTGL